LNPPEKPLEPEPEPNEFGYFARGGKGGKHWVSFAGMKWIKTQADCDKETKKRREIAFQKREVSTER